MEAEDGKLDAVEVASAAFAQGGCVIVVDSLAGGLGQRRCSLAAAAEHITNERVAFVVRHSTGVVSACLERERLEGFGLQPLAGSHGGDSGSYMPINISAGPGMTSGASAKDRATTIKALCDTSNPPASFSTPGHTFPSCAAQGGVLKRAEAGEAVVDLCRISRLTPVGVLAEMMQEDGTLYSAEAAARFSQEHNIPLLTVEQLCAYRRARETLTKSPDVAFPFLETESQLWIEDVEAQCRIRVYSTIDPKVEIVAMVKGEVQDSEGVPVRVHSECFTGDILASKRCDCGQQLHKFLKILNLEACGVLLYIRGHEGRGIGLANKIRAYKLQDEGLDTVDANIKLGLPVDTRTYDDALSVVRHLGIRSIRLFTNNPEKTKALEPITREVVALASTPFPQNIAYLRTKRERLNHKTVLETFRLPKVQADVSKIRVGLVYTKWNSYYVDPLVQAAEAELNRTGVRRVKLAVPGACELVSGARALLRHQKPDAIVALGILIRGSSDIYDATCTAVMTGLTELNASQDVPIIHGVLMCHDEGQADERTHGPNNPARAWAETALHMASICTQIETHVAE